MIAPDDKKPLGKGGKSRAESVFIDPWADWRPEWPQTPRGRRKAAAPDKPSGVHAWQEKRSPTTPVQLRGAAADGAGARRRIVDARLWDAMTGAQQDAALQIAEAFEAMSSGLGYRTSDWQHIPGTAAGGAGAAHSRLIHGYVEWTKNCHREKISHAMVVDILVFGSSCRQQDRDRRLRGGSARRNLMDGLTLYCLLQGWPTVR